MVQFRIDDVGASTKWYNQHSKEIYRSFRIFDFWFLKRLKLFKGWAIYDELNSSEWEEFLQIFQDNNIRPIIAITACWVDNKSNLIPFPEKFPKQATLLKKALDSDIIAIANHGLTHCVVGKHMPRFLSSNRQYHREFLPYLDQSVHTEHIIKSQKILEDYFGQDIEILVPPGNMWSKKTYRALCGTNIKKIVCNSYMVDSDEEMKDVEFINDKKDFFNFHDRELKLFGKKWLLEKINYYKNL